MPGKLWEFPDWADPESCGWDHDTGAPTISHFSNALQVWSMAQDRPCSVAEAAMTFNIAPRRIIEAVEHHGWMLLVGDPKGDVRQLMIEHDGE